MFIRAYGFVDDGYLRKLATDHVKSLLDPHLTFLTHVGWMQATDLSPFPPSATG